METRPLALLLALLLAPSASAWDIRDCPLSSLTFVDPWGGARFEVAQAAQSVFYLCDGMREVVATEQPEGCAGPYGEVLLAGRLTDPVHGKRQLIARYTQFPAALCCLWNYQPQAGTVPYTAEAAWYSHGQGPTLRQWPFAAITIRPELLADDHAELYPTEQLIAVSCEDFMG